MQIQAARRELAARELVDYVDYVHTPQYPVARHQMEWADIFMHPVPGKPHTAIICPPGSGKTSWCSKFFPAFFCGQDTSKHIGIIASTDKRAWKLSLSIRDTVTDLPRYQEVFPHVKPDKSKGWARGQWFLQRPRKDDPDPTVTTCGVFGDLLGARLDMAIFDDTFDEETINSDTLRTRARNWIRNTAMTRLDPRTGRAIALFTRWPGVTDDLVAEFKDDPLWQIIHMPAINYYGDGNSLWPDRIPLQFLLAEQRRDPGTFEAVYQGNPHQEEGNLFKKDWWVWLDMESDSQWPVKFDRVIQAWDTAYKKGKKNDYSSCVTIGLFKGTMFVLDVMREKFEWPALLKNAQERYKTFRPSHVLIEDSASGQNLIQALKDQSDPIIPVIPSIRGQQDLRSFVTPITGYVEGHRVVLPKSRPWAQQFEINMRRFHPDREQKNDDVLAFTHAVRYLAQGGHVNLTDDCIVVVGAESEAASMGQRLSSALGMMGSTMNPSTGGSNFWFDQM